MAQAADFFVSYTSADRAWAEWIAWQLEAEGYTVVVQAWDFTAGHDWAHQMQQATTTAERVVAVLSPSYLASLHGEAEWRAFYAKDPSGEHALLLPVRVSEVEPPGLLTTRIYVDLVGRDATSARMALLSAARGTRGKPVEAPEFPGNRRSEVSAIEAPRFPGELPPVWNVPFHPNPFFIGRQLLLAEIHARLMTADAISRRVVLTGLAGMGKTQLAVEYAYVHQADYDLVWWVRCEQPSALLGDYTALAGEPQVATNLELTGDASQEAVAAAVRGWLERHHRWLLVLDNVEHPQAVTELLPRGATGHVLVTSQAETDWAPLAGEPVPVHVLAPADAADLLLSRAKEKGPEAQTAATTLASSLGGLPLALEQAGAYVAATGTVTLASYAELFATRALELLKRAQPLDYHHTVATTWSLALQKLQDIEPATVGLLNLAAFLAPDDLPQPLLTIHAEQLPEELANVTRDPLALGDAVAALRRYSLVRIVADGLFVHRLLQTVVRAALDRQAELTWAASAVRLVRAGFPNSDGAVATWPECERLLPHLLAAVGHGRRLDVEPERWTWLLSQAGLYLWSRGQYRRAATLEAQALTGYRRVLGDDHPETLGSMSNLAVTRRTLGDLQGARDLHERALAGYVRVLGEDHPDTLGSMNNLAAARWALGDLHGARELHEQALAGCRRVLGDDHPVTLTAMNNLAETRRTLGDFQGARHLHEQTLATSRRVLGEDHPNTLGTMSNLALARRALGDLHGARDLHEQALTGRRRVLGEDHPATLNSMNNLAASLTDLGNLLGARDLHKQASAGRRRVLGEDHPDTLQSMNNLADVRRLLGELSS